MTMPDPNSAFAPLEFGSAAPGQTTVDVGNNYQSTTPLEDLTITPQVVNPDYMYTGAASIPGVGTNSPFMDAPSGNKPKPWNPWENIPERQRVSMMTDREESPWAKLQREMAASQYGRAQGLVGAQSMAGMQGGMNSLAAQGGLTGGGRVAMANNATAQRIKGTQQLAGNYQDTLRKISGQDIENQINQENKESQNQYNADTWAFEQKLNNFNNNKRADSLAAQQKAQKPGSAWWQPKNWF